MISKSFTDFYGTEVIVRKNEAHDHVQLLLRYADNSTSYGFTVEDFERFAESVAVVNVLAQVAS